MAKAPDSIKKAMKKSKPKVYADTVAASGTYKKMTRVDRGKKPVKASGVTRAASNTYRNMEAQDSYPTLKKLSKQLPKAQKTATTMAKAYKAKDYAKLDNLTTKAARQERQIKERIRELKSLPVVPNRKEVMKDVRGVRDNLKTAQKLEQSVVQKRQRRDLLGDNDTRKYSEPVKTAEVRLPEEVQRDKYKLNSDDLEALKTFVPKNAKEARHIRERISATLQDRDHGGIPTEVLERYGADYDAAIVDLEHYERLKKAGKDMKKDKWGDRQILPEDVWDPNERRYKNLVGAAQHFDRMIAGEEGFYPGENTNSMMTVDEKYVNELPDEEKNVYNYLFYTKGEEEANKFLEDSKKVNRKRYSERLAKQLDENDSIITDTAAAITQGGTQFATGLVGVKDALTGGYTDLSDVEETESAAINKRRSHIDGVSGVMFDLVNTISNQVPSMVLGGLAGGTAGSAVLGASAGGNTYREMKKQGYSKEQARGVGLVTGALEATLQRAMGGMAGMTGTKVTALGDKLTRNMSSLFGKKLTTGLLEMGGEALEEGSQEFLAPFVKSLFTGSDIKVNWDDVGYSALLGALSSGVTNSVTMGLSGDTDVGVEDTLKEYSLDNHKGRKLGRQIKADTDYVDNLQTLREAVETEENNGKEGMAQRVENATDVALAESDIDNADTAATIKSAIVKDATGQALTEAEQNALTSPAGQAVQLAVTDNVKQNIKQDAVVTHVANEILADNTPAVRQAVTKMLTGQELSRADEQLINASNLQEDMAKIAGVYAQQIGATAENARSALHLDSIAQPNTDSTPLLIADSQGNGVEVRSVEGDVVHTDQGDIPLAEAQLESPQAEELLERGSALPAAEQEGFFKYATPTVNAETNMEWYLQIKDLARDGIPINAVLAEYTELGMSSDGIVNAYAQGELNAESIPPETNYSEIPENVMVDDSVNMDNREVYSRVTVLSAMSSMFGYDVHVINDPDAPAGSYEHNTMTVNLAADDAMGTAFTQTISHEMVHWGKENAPGQYYKYRHELFNYLARKGFDIEKEVQDRIDLYGYDRETALDEMAAEGGETLLRDGDAIDTVMADKKTENFIKRAFERVKHFFYTLFYGDVETTSNITRTITDSTEQELKSVISAYDDMILSSRENANSGKGAEVSQPQRDSFIDSLIEASAREEAETKERVRKLDERRKRANESQRRSIELAKEIARKKAEEAKTEEPPEDEVYKINRPKATRNRVKSEFLLTTIGKNGYEAVLVDGYVQKVNGLDVGYYKKGGKWKTVELKTGTSISDGTTLDKAKANVKKEANNVKANITNSTKGTYKAGRKIINDAYKNGLHFINDVQKIYGVSADDIRARIEKNPERKGEQKERLAIVPEGGPTYDRTLSGDLVEREKPSDSSKATAVETSNETVDTSSETVEPSNEIEKTEAEYEPTAEELEEEEDVKLSTDDDIDAFLKDIENVDPYSDAYYSNGTDYSDMYYTEDNDKYYRMTKKQREIFESLKNTKARDEFQRLVDQKELTSGLLVAPRTARNIARMLAKDVYGRDSKGVRAMEQEAEKAFRNFYEVLKEKGSATTWSDALNVFHDLASDITKNSAFSDDLAECVNTLVEMYAKADKETTLTDIAQRKIDQYKAKTEERIKTAKLKRKTAELRKKLIRKVDRLSKRTTAQRAGVKQIAPEMKQALAEMLSTLNTESTSSRATKLNADIATLREKLRAIAKDKDYIQLTDMWQLDHENEQNRTQWSIWNEIDKLGKILEGQQLRSLGSKNRTLAQDFALLEQANKIATTIERGLQKINSLNSYENYVSMAEQAAEVVKDLRKAGHAEKKASILRRVSDAYGDMRTPVTYQLERAVGYNEDSPLYKAKEELVHADREMNMKRMEWMKQFAPEQEGMTPKQIKAARKAFESSVEDLQTTPFTDKNGKPVKLTKMEMFELVLTYEREINHPFMSHLTESGAVFLDRELLAKGKIKEAEVHGTWISPEQITQKNIADIEATFTPWDQEYLGKIKDFMRNTVHEEVNDYYFKTRGYKITPEEFYYPERTPASERSQTIGNIDVDEITPGWEHELNKDANQSALLGSALSTVNRMINQVSERTTLHVAMDNLESLLNTRPVNGNGFDRMNLRAEMIKAIGQKTMNGIDKKLSDVRGKATDTSPESEIFQKLIGFYANSKIVANPGTLITVGMSMLQIKAYVGPKAFASMWGQWTKRIVKNKGKVGFRDGTDGWLQQLRDEIDEHSATNWMRREGDIGDYQAELARQFKKSKEAGKGIGQNKVVKGVTDAGKAVLSAPGKALTFMDATATLLPWLACKAEVKAQGVKEGTEAYWKKVADMYDTFMEQTQSSDSVLHKPGMMNGGTVLKMLTLFKNEVSKTGALIENRRAKYFAKRAAYNDDPTEANKKAMKQARKEFTRSVVATTNTMACMSLVAIVRAITAGKPFEDEEGSILSWLLNESADAVVQDAVSYASPIIGNAFWSVKEYDQVTTPVITDVVNIFRMITNTYNAGKLGFNEEEMKKAGLKSGDFKKYLRYGIQSMFEAVGVPAGSINKMTNGVLNAVGAVRDNRPLSKGRTKTYGDSETEYQTSPLQDLVDAIADQLLK